MDIEIGHSQAKALGFRYIRKNKQEFQFHQIIIESRYQ